MSSHGARIRFRDTNILVRGKMRFFFEKQAQSSVEAAFIIPVCAVLLLCLLQTLCLFYTKAIMYSASQQAIRALQTTTDTGAVQAFVKRRLAMVPEVSLFHNGGMQDWIVDCAKSEAHLCQITIRGHAKPLPLFYGALRLFVDADEKGIVLEEKTSSRVRPQWLEGDYEAWVSLWEQ